MRGVVTMMHFLRNIPIRTKVTAMIALASTVVLVLALAVVMTKDYLNLRSDQLDQLTTLARVVSANSTAAVAFDDRDAAAESLRTLSTTPQVKYAFIWSKKDSTVMASFTRSGGPLEQAAAADLMRHATAPQELRTDEQDMYARVAIVLDGDEIGTLYVVSDLSRLYARIQEYIWIGLGVLGSAILVALLVSVLFGSGDFEAAVEPERRHARDRDRQAVLASASRRPATTRSASSSTASMPCSNRSSCATRS